ncbi:MAG: metalloregulator ArsR/SmtB family transcription factor [Solirubrobacterales bacterium]|nr:metalloregulator ArsR/SmtB family transcription factor [Solirubrobacterales bacterium]
MREPFHPPVEELELVSVLHALSDPTRLFIVRTLAAEGERTCGSFEAPGGVSAATLSHHFRVLREAGVTRTRIDGKCRHTSLRREELEARFPGLLESVVAAAPAPA